MDADTGNPWLAIPKTYKGKFEVTAGDGVTLTTPYIMLSSDNDVSFMGNATCDTYAAGETLFTLPEECCPDVGVSVCVPATFTRSTGGGTEQRRIQFTIPEQSTTVTIAEQTVKVTGGVSAATDEITVNVVIPQSQVSVPAQSVDIARQTVKATLDVDDAKLTGTDTLTVTPKDVQVWAQSNEKRLISNGSGFAVADYTVPAKTITVPSQTLNVAVTIDDTGRKASGDIIVPAQEVTVGGATITIPQRTIPLSFDVDISGQTATGNVTIPQSVATVTIPGVDVDTTATISVPSVSGEYTEPIVMDVDTDGRCTLTGEYVNLTLLLVGNSFNIGCNWYRLEA